MAKDSTLRLMKEFDDLIVGIPSIFDPATEVLDIEKLAERTSFTEYTNYGDGVMARNIRHANDVKYPAEEAARSVLKSIHPKPGKQWAMFQRFLERGKMRLQCHPQKEWGYLVEGSIRCLHSNRKWRKGDVFEFARMEKHEPYSEEGCLILVVFTGILLSS